MREGIAGWPIHEEVLLALRAKMVDTIQVKVVETGDSYVTGLDRFFERGPGRKWVQQNYSGKGNQLLRSLPLSEWMHFPAPAKLKLGA
jgi:hypothetical protein